MLTLILLLLITVGSILSPIAFGNNCNRDIWTISNDNSCHYSNGEFRLQCSSTNDCNVRLNASLQLGIGIYSAKIKAAQADGVYTKFYLFSYKNNDKSHLHSIGVEFLGQHINNEKTKILTTMTTTKDVSYVVDFLSPEVVTVNWNASQQFHTYQIQIDETNISWIFDDIIYRRLNYFNKFSDLESIINTSDLYVEISLSNKKLNNDFPITASFQSIELIHNKTRNKKRKLIEIEDKNVLTQRSKKFNRLKDNKRFIHFIFLFVGTIICMCIIYVIILVSKCFYKTVQNELKLYDNGSMYCQYGTALHEFPITVAYTKIIILSCCISIGVFIAITSEDHQFVWYFLIYDLIKIPVNILAFFALWGLLIIPKDDNISGPNEWNDDIMIIFRWVTRGTHPKLIHHGIERNWAILKKYKNTAVEILTESKLNIDASIYGIPSHRFAETYTPKSFKCKNGTLFKARGLHNGALNSKLSLNRINNCYIFHCDEESLVTDSLVVGIKRFITFNYGVIGQGQKAYKNEEYTLSSYLCHMIDSSRAGYDASTFLCQQWVFKQAMFGFHGSFVLVPHKTEISVETSFDNCGEYGSIAEDAWWCYLPGNINNIGWCAGTLIEDSPFTLSDIIKQRNRWFTGLYLLIKHHPIEWKKKALLTMSIYCWALLGPFVCITIFHLIWHGPFRIFTSYNIIMSLINNCANMVWLTNFLTGQLLLIHKNYFEKFISIIILPILLPFMLLIESFGVMSAILSPDTKFNLVKKEGQNTKNIDIDIPIQSHLTDTDTNTDTHTDIDGLIYHKKKNKNKIRSHYTDSDTDSDSDELILSQKEKYYRKNKNKNKNKKKRRSHYTYTDSDGLILSEKDYKKKKKKKKKTGKTKGPMSINIQLTLSNEQIMSALQGSQFTIPIKVPQNKRVSEWKCVELIEWINSLNNLDDKIKKKIVKIIKKEEITGSDFNLFKHIIDIMDIFEIRKLPATKILNAFHQKRKQNESVSSDETSDESTSNNEYNEYDEYDESSLPESDEQDDEEKLLIDNTYVKEEEEVIVNHVLTEVIPIENRNKYQLDNDYKKIFKDTMSSMLKNNPMIDTILQLINKTVMKDNIDNNQVIGKPHIEIVCKSDIELSNQSNGEIEDKKNENEIEKEKYVCLLNDILKQEKDDDTCNQINVGQQVKLNDEYKQIKYQHYVEYKMVIPLLFIAICVVIWWISNTDYLIVLSFGGNILMLGCVLLNLCMMYCWHRY